MFFIDPHHKAFQPIRNQFMTQGFHHIWYTLDEAAQIIASCEERLLKVNTITKPFTVAEIQEGILKDHLCEDDYLAPHKVNANRL